MQGTVKTLDEVALDEAREQRRALLQIGPAIMAVAALAAGFGLWAQHRRPAAPPDFLVVQAPATSSALPTAASFATAPRPEASAAIVSNPYGALVDRAFFLTAGPPVSPPNPARQASAQPAPPAVAEAVPLPPRRELDEAADSAPLPPRRPAEFASLTAPPAANHSIMQESARTAEPSSADDRNFFEKLFGPRGATSAAVAPPPGRGAGAAPGLFANLFGAGGPPAGYDKLTAVYDISARTVYMPDGTRLEAHSGLGDRLDDPVHVSERMRGATPPHLYELQPREASFHGVPALRLIPVGGGDLFGRSGLLAHSYMLGPNGDSNGCVSFKDYDAFLHAYQNGQIKRLAVVSRL
jgi:hypothetical protein